MRKPNTKPEALKQLIWLAQEDGFSPELLQLIAAHCREQRAAGASLESIADELGLTTWEVADRSHLEALYQEYQEPSQLKTPMMVLKVPMTPRFERILARETSRALQKCDSCCWEHLKRSLPEEFLAGKEDEEA